MSRWQTPSTTLHSYTSTDNKVTKFRPVLCFRRLLQSTQMCMGQIIARQRMHWPKQVSDMVLDQMKFSCTVRGLLSSFTLFLCYVCAYSECHDPSLYADLSHFCMQCYADQDMNVCCCWSVTSITPDSMRVLQVALIATVLTRDSPHLLSLSRVLLLLSTQVFHTRQM